MCNQKSLSSRVLSNLVNILAILSGCCGLAYEVLYVRALTTILGDMFYVHAALLSTFLLGIGLGSKLAHRWIRWLWLFQILTGIYAFALPTITKWLAQQPVMAAITSSSLLTIFATISFLALPSLLIGFSIPLFSAYMKVYRVDRLAFQGIYKAYNFGAFVSILAIELVLVRHFGVTASLVMVGAVNLLNGIVLLLMKTTSIKALTANPIKFGAHITIALGLASFSSAVFQMFFLKLSYLVFYPHRENFAIALSVTLLGLFIGTWLVSTTRIRFETLLIFMPVVIGLVYINYIHILSAYEETITWARSSELLILSHKFLFGCVFALGPMILFGGLIPALMRRENEVAGESGHLLWISSLANATGYLVYVLVGHSLMSNDAILFSVAGIAILASLLATNLRWSRFHKILAASGLVLMGILIFQWKERNLYLAHWVRSDRVKPSDEVTVFKSGAESATLVCSEKNSWITYNGHPSIYVEIHGTINHSEMMGGIIPALSAPRLDRVLVLGLGTGITAGTAACVFKTTDVVEINNAFYKMLPHLRYANLKIDQNPAANMFLSDGRAFLVGREGLYDAIVSSIPTPTYFSASKIYTVEFYKRAAKALKPDGVFCSWLSTADMSEAGIYVVLSALRGSFRYCDLRLLRRGYCITTCSNNPIRTRHFSDLPAREDMVEQLKAGLRGIDLDEFFTDTRISDNVFDHFIPEVDEQNTDDHPVLEFMVVRAHQLGKLGGSDPLLEKQALFNIDPVRWDEPIDNERFARRAAIFYLHDRRYFKKNFSPILRENPEIMSHLLLWAGDIVKHDDPQKTIILLKKALSIRPDFAQAHYVLGTIFESQDQHNDAISHYRQALKLQPDLSSAHDRLENILKLQKKTE